MSINPENTTTNTAPVASTESPLASNHETNSNPVNSAPAATNTVPVTSATKVTPIQRINSVYEKAKLQFNEVLNDAQKNVNGQKSATAATSAAANGEKTTSTTPGNKVYSWKDILNLVKGTQKPSPAQPVDATTGAPTTTNTGTQEVPVTSAKDGTANTTSHNSGSPAIDQLKRNATILATFILQKKKEYTGNQSSENQPTTSGVNADLHNENGTVDTNTTVNPNAKPPTPLGRRISQMVTNATANYNKKKEQRKSGVPIATADAPTASVEPNVETPAANTTHVA